VASSSAANPLPRCRVRARAVIPSQLPAGGAKAEKGTLAIASATIPTGARRRQARPEPTLTSPPNVTDRIPQGHGLSTGP
jgi:hypothetical protein